MPENIVAVEPEPSEPVIKDTADSSTMKYFIGIVALYIIISITVILVLAIIWFQIQ